MESFSSESRYAVQNAFNALRETIGRELENEIEKRLKQDGQSHEFLIEELEILRTRTEEVDRLEEENRRLRSKLLQFHQQNRVTESPRETPRPRALMHDQATNTEPKTTDSSDNGGDLEQVLRESHKLHRRYNALDKNFKLLKEEFQKRREENKRWEEYAASLEAKIKRIEDRHGQSIDPTHATQSASKPSRPRLAATSSFSSDPGAEPRLAVTAAEVPAEEHIKPRTAPAHSDQTRDLSTVDSTEGETTEGSNDVEMPVLPPLRQPTNPAPEIHIKPELSSDGPVFVSERHVGKRKRHDDLATNEPGRRKVKVESPKAAMAGLPSTQLQQESMDLDEVGQRLNTPRKNRHLDAERAKTTEPVFVRPDVISTPTTRSFDNPAVLTPVNPNARTVRPCERKIVEKPTKKGLAADIGTLAEDGLAYKKPGRGELVEGQFRTPQPAGRLRALLNVPSPEQAPAIVRSAPRLRDTNTLEDDGSLFPERRSLPFNKDRRDKSRDTTSNQKETHETVGPTPTRNLARNRAAVGAPLASSKPALRSRPVASLRLDDFKINPKFNGGSDYAYSEVVRGKDDRACLPGCTDMNCCGKHFRAMALAQKNNADRTPASDNKLFEDYLGDRISTVWGMSKAEKEELWVEAKTWQLANELGKHRHRYARRSSPPGFWNTDFPSTQEVEAEKAEAEKREKQMILERHREAIRGGGRWVFRDE
ncbi:DNA repair protein [Colletotrichum truncatum]|uniref:DNA repair protein n=1 Tax=Colletotrichum truncatum TaxID=5467 RepID=A0ACC3ZFX1_COLTU|nr:DNA repair protein [Colletotrichum truncatum]KAF6801726.1 DNA repair protein [Colletotrichum truncatum]